MPNSRALGLRCCCSENPFTDGKRICCDGEDCDCFNQRCRDCFWPDFTHPTWLRCNILYGCCSPRCRRCRRRDD